MYTKLTICAMNKKYFYSHIYQIDTLSIHVHHTIPFSILDFSDELANLTLAEKPNALYKSRSRSWLDRYDTTSTDSEEVDSDSGYSSPLHRRNQASSGTHPAGMTPYLPATPGATPVLLPLPDPSHSQHLLGQQPHVAVTRKATYAKAAAAYLHTNAHSNPAALLTGNHGASSFPGAAGLYPATANSTATSSSVATPFLQGYPPLASGIAAGMGKAATLSSSYLGTSNPEEDKFVVDTHESSNSTNSKVNSLSVSGHSSGTSPGPSKPTSSSCQRQHTSSVCSSVKSEPEEVTDGASTSGAPGTLTRKKRRRSRRRKKRGGGGEDTGALSDEPLEMLQRAHSSSNVSRTSTDPHTDRLVVYLTSGVQIQFQIHCGIENDVAMY